MGHVLTTSPASDTNTIEMGDQTPDNYMKVYYEWEREYLEELAEKMRTQSKRDFWRNSKSDNAATIYESGMDYIKEAREAALEEADRIREQGVIRAGMQGLQETRPHLYSAAHTGSATLSELKDLDTIISSTRPKQDETWQRWLHGASSAYNALSAAEKQAYIERGFVKSDGKIDRSRVIEDIAGKEFLASKQRSLAPVTTITNTQKAESAYAQELGKKEAQQIAGRLKRVLHSGALTEVEGRLNDINRAIKIVGSGQFKTGPTAPARLWLQRFIDDTFGTGLRMNPNGDPDLEATKEQRALIRSIKDGLIGKHGSITNVALGEQLKMIGENLGLGYLSKTKGAISDREMALFMNIGFNLSKSPDGNLRILNILKRSHEKQLAEREVTIQLLKEIDEGKIKVNGETITNLSQLPYIKYTLYMAKHFASKWGFNPETGVGSIITPDDVSAALAVEDEQVQGAGTDGIELPSVAGWKIGKEIVNSSNRPDAAILKLEELPEPTCTSNGDYCVIIRTGKDGIKRAYRVSKEGK